MNWVLVGGVVALAIVGIVISGAFAVGARRQLVTLGQLSANGADEHLLRRTLSLQGLLSGAIGSVVGFGAGVVVLFAMRHQFESWIHHDPGPYVWSLRDVIAILVTGTIAATVAAFVPARSAARVPVLSALAGRRPLGAAAEATRADRPRAVRLRRVAPRAGRRRIGRSPERRSRVDRGARRAARPRGRVLRELDRRRAAPPLRAGGAGRGASGVAEHHSQPGPERRSRDGARGGERRCGGGRRPRSTRTPGRRSHDVAFMPNDTLIVSNGSDLSRRAADVPAVPAALVESTLRKVLPAATWSTRRAVIGRRLGEC